MRIADRAALAASALALMIAAPLRAEVVDSAENGFTVRQSVEVARSADEVWAELLAPAKWWDPAHTWSKDASGLYIDAQATGCFCELLPKNPDAPEGARRGSVEHMHVIHVNPGKVLLMAGELGPLQADAVTGKLAIVLKPGEGGKTRIFWEYTVGGYFRTKVADLAPGVDAVLGQQLARLAQRLEPAAQAPAEAAPADQPVAKPAAKGKAPARGKAAPKPAPAEAVAPADPG